MGTFQDLMRAHDGDRAVVDQIMKDRREEANTTPMGEVVDRLGLEEGRRRSGAELSGPCPSCGGRDRFGVNLQKGVFNCRGCQAKGGPVQLVQLTLGCDYGPAVDWLIGAVDVTISQEELARREKERAEQARRRAKEQEAFRARAIKAARKIWEAGAPATNTAAHRYLILRGISHEALPVVPPTLRFAPNHVYSKRLGRPAKTVTMHRGPAMLAAIQDAKGRVVAVHQTWIDLSRTSGKAHIRHDGEAQPAKLVRGSKKGGAIRLTSAEGCDALVMGEGIETTLSAMLAGGVQNAAYWAGVDLGNMGGRQRRAPDPETGKMTSASGVPDMDDKEAFVPPPWVRRLYFIQDGDSDPVATRAVLLAGLRRAMTLRPGIECFIVPAPAGMDMNDLLNKGGSFEEVSHG